MRTGFWRIASTLSLGLLVPLACTRDFDALFEWEESPDDGEDGGTSDATGAGGDARVNSGDAQGEAGGDATSPSVEVLECQNRTGCSVSCGSGRSCTNECQSDFCSPSCEGCARASFTCGSQSSICGAKCNGGGTCETDCQGDVCTLECSADSKCLLRCAGGGSCNLECAGGGERRNCGGGVWTCNQACPG